MEPCWEETWSRHVPLQAPPVLYRRQEELKQAPLSRMLGLPRAEARLSRDEETTKALSILLETGVCKVLSTLGVDGPWRPWSQRPLYTWWREGSPTQLQPLSSRSATRGQALSSLGLERPECATGSPQPTAHHQPLWKEASLTPFTNKESRGSHKPSGWLRSLS